MTASVLFVCLGNICRSPTAEAVFRHQAGAAGLSVITDSAGTSSWHIGEPPDRRAQSAAGARGYDLSTLRGRQMTAEDFEVFDIIVGMDRANIAKIEVLRPAGNDIPVRLLLDYGEKSERSEVPDPYYDDGFDRVIDMVEDACSGLLKTLGA